MTVSKPPTRQQIATWVMECLDDLGEHIIKAAWRRNGYTYFPQDKVQVQLNIEQDTWLNDKLTYLKTPIHHQKQLTPIQHLKHLITTTNIKNFRT